MSSDFVQSLDRGLRVITSFDRNRQRQTLADVARETDLTRATARRLLLTLVELGYVRTDGKYFELTPLILDIGYSFIASLGLNAIAQPFVEAFSEEVRESSSISVIDDTDIVYVLRVPAKRIMTVSIGLGSRFPAYQTSMGRALLAELDDDHIADVYGRSDHTAATERTVGSAEELLAAIDAVRTQGWALVDQELELGVRSLATVIRDGRDEAIAALNVSMHAGRTGLEEVSDFFLPRLLETASQIESALATR